MNDNIDKSLVYTKAMIGLHTKSPIKTTVLNKARPFLNTLFVIKKVNELWKKDDNEPKGILKHEFGAFVLSMKDCDYNKCAEEIIKYRKKYKSEINEKYIYDYLEKREIEKYNIKSITVDYPDEVFRKFEMTGLLTSHGSYYKYYNFSLYNIEKINLILEYYKDYKFETFSDAKAYYDYLYNIFIPWENNFNFRKKIAKAKASYLGRSFNDKISIEEEEMQLDRAFGSSALKKAVAKYDLKFIFKELMILAKIEKSKSKFNDIKESLRLEYLLALAIGKLYGLEGVVSNIIYNEDGEPMHCALGKQCDLLVFREDGSLILEPTMLTSRDQQSRNETTSINRHADEINETITSPLKVLMIAPKIHRDTIDYFTYRSEKSKIEMVALTICRIVGLFGKNLNYKDMYDEISAIYKYYKDNEADLNVCADFMNKYLPDKILYS